MLFKEMVKKKGVIDMSEEHRKILSKDILSAVTHDIFGTYFIEKNSFPKIYNDGTIGRTFFNDRCKRDKAINAATAAKINVLYTAVLHGNSSYNVLQITQLMNACISEYTGVSAEYLQFYIDDSDELRKQKINGWLIMIGSIMNFAMNKISVDACELREQLEKNNASIMHSVSQYVDGTFTSQIFQRMQNEKDCYDDSSQIDNNLSIPQLSSPEEYYRLGCLYEFGEDGYEKDIIMARRLYEKAALDGNILAQYNYAICLLHGKGGDKQPKDSMFFLEKAANSGLPEAMYNLGLMLLHGEIEKNAEKARFWLESAEKLGHAEASNWIKCCILMESIQNVEHVTKTIGTIQYVNSMEDLINAISYDDIIKVSDMSINATLLNSMADGIFQIANDVVSYSQKEHELDNVKFWRNVQAALLLFVLVGDIYSYDSKAFIAKIDGQLFLDIWEEQKRPDLQDIPFNCSILNIAVHQRRIDSAHQDFWAAIIKVADLLARVERKIKEEKNNIQYVAIHPIDRLCKKARVEISGLCLSINKEDDITIRGTIEALDGYKDLDKCLQVNAVLYNKYGQVLYTLNSFSDMRLSTNVFSTFSLYCAKITRFIDLKQLHTINVYPSWTNIE